MWLTIRSIKSAGLVGRRKAPPRTSGRGSLRRSRPASGTCTICIRRVAKNSRTTQSVGCTVSSTRSKTAKPTGLVSIASSACLAVESVPRSSSTNIALLPAPAARRRKTSMS